MSISHYSEAGTIYRRLYEAEKDFEGVGSSAIYQFADYRKINAYVDKTLYVQSF